MELNHHCYTVKAKEVLTAGAAMGGNNQQKIPMKSDDGANHTALKLTIKIPGMTEQH